ncbi:MAG: PHB depolymerase family esterase [Aliidongia sp.]
MAALKRGVLVVIALALAGTPASAADAIAGQTGLQTGIVFREDSELAHNAELIRRSVSPLTAWRLQRQAAAAGATIRDRPIDLATETFTLYVPDTAPARGYAVLVFIPPWRQAAMPPHWGPVFDRHDMIFVSAANSGNDAVTLDRREPLALLAAVNVMKRYLVDPQRVYVGGFSGGSKVALRVAVGYPDLFHGALLDAGSDPLGGEIAIPPAPLLHRLQEATRLVYLTGGHDEFHLTADKTSRRSMESGCVADIDTEAMPKIWHEPADPASLDRALTALEQHIPADPATLAACRAALDAAMNAALQQVEGLAAAGKREEAEARLNALDQRFGALATPRSIELAEKIEAGR